MAITTNIDLRSKMIYQVFPRNYSNEGTFNQVTNDLDRIKALGTDILYLLPIHPIGEKMRKGTLGSPYAIKNYREINPELGTLEDFKELVDKTHDKEMKLMIDIVFNHTSPDSYLRENHPEYFYRKPDGNFGNKIGDWWDIIDLDIHNKDLQDELISTLLYWASLGVDGFRCDVAPLLPIEFWNRVRSLVNSKYPNTIWLAESVEPSFIHYLRGEKHIAHSDSEVFNAFDISYDYDVYPYFKGYFENKNTLEEYLQLLRIQEYIYPANYVKLHFLENHDQLRIANLTKNNKLAIYNWTAFSFFNKGCAFVYAGQEAFALNQPSLFDKDLVDLNNIDTDYSNFISKLSQLKKDELVLNHKLYTIHKTNCEIIYATYENDSEILIGIFNVGQKENELSVILNDGNYTNILDNELINVKDNMIQNINKPIIIRDKKTN